MQRMRDVLRGSLARSLRELPDEDRLAAAWPVACGPALAAHAQVLHLDAEHVLHVRVDGSEWMQQFLHMRSALANDASPPCGSPGYTFKSRDKSREVCANAIANTHRAGVRV
jgi:predicted nucleic acid-binding Zn ribbon protein